MTITMHETRHTMDNEGMQINETETKEITRKQYDNITNKETLQFFRKLGGSEVGRREYTCAGYLITRLRSTSPDRKNGTLRIFEFKL